MKERVEFWSGYAIGLAISVAVLIVVGVPVIVPVLAISALTAAVGTHALASLIVRHRWRREAEQRVLALKAMPFLTDYQEFAPANRRREEW